MIDTIIALALNKHEASTFKKLGKLIVATVFHNSGNRCILSMRKSYDRLLSLVGSKSDVASIFIAGDRLCPKIGNKNVFVAALVFIAGEPVASCETGHFGFLFPNSCEAGSAFVNEAVQIMEISVISRVLLRLGLVLRRGKE